MHHWLHWIDLMGVAVFAISGTLMAFRKHMDGFGVIVLASVTAIGGGTLRDMILDLPVFWVQSSEFLYTIAAAALLTIIWLRVTHRFPYKALLVADALGLAVFNVMGLQKALDYGTGPVIAIVMGTMTGVFGGLMRDVICRDVPLVLKGELYATTCIFGSLIYLTISWGIGSTNLAMMGAVFGTLILRVIAIYRHWQLPLFQGLH